MLSKRTPAQDQRRSVGDDAERIAPARQEHAGLAVREIRQRTASPVRVSFKSQVTGARPEGYTGAVFKFEQMPFIKLDARINTYHPPPRCFNAQRQIIPCPPLTGKARIAAIVVCSIVGAIVLASAVFYFCQWCCCCCCCRRKRKQGAPAEPKEQASNADEEEEDARPLRTDEQQYQSEGRESEDTVRGYADDKSNGQYDYDDMDRQLDGMFRTTYDDDKGREESSYSYPPIPMPSYAGPSYAGPSYGGRAYAGGANI